MWQRLRGHRELVELFRRAINRQRTAHAYLFVGPSGIGKRLFATMFAQAMFCERIPDDDFDACGECSACRQILAQTHPDLITIGCPEGKRELPISLIAGAKEGRGKEGLCHEIAMRPMSASRRIAIIDDADAMNDESANALLKTLEEPPRGAILFLLSPSVDSILPTIRSRCQIVRFSPLSQEDIEQLLLDLGEVQNLEQAQNISPFAEGNLTTARQLLDAGLLELKSVVERCVHAHPIDPLKATKLILDVFEVLGGDTAKQREHMHWTNQFCIESLRRSLHDTIDSTEVDQLAAMLDRCFEAELHLRQTMPVNLCLESLFGDLARISRTTQPIR